MQLTGQQDKLTGRFDVLRFSAESFRDQQTLKTIVDAVLDGESDVLIVRRGELVAAFGFRNGERKDEEITGNDS